MQEKAKCRHCQVKAANRPRGLCWVCYHAEGVREQYPSESVYASRGLGVTGDDEDIEEGPPGPPTMAWPGSPDKVAVLHQRAREGRPLFVRGDRRLDLR